MIDLIVYSILGAAAGVTAGLLGVGGGIVIVPILVWWLPDSLPMETHMHIAVATSLAVIVPVSLSSMWKHHKQHNIDWSIFRSMAIVLSLGAIVGAIVASYLPRLALQIIFGVFELIVAANLLFARASEPHALKTTNLYEMRGVSFAVGMVSSILGVGGGTMTAPYLRWRGMDMRRAIGTSAACGLPIAVTAFMAWMVLNPDVADSLPGTSGYVYWPAMLGITWSAVLFAPLGAMLTQKLPVITLRYVFAFVLVVVATRLLWSASGV